MAADLWPRQRQTAADHAALVRLGEVLERQKWTFAKTMPYNPHWYSLRQTWSEPDEDFLFAVDQIRRFGYFQKYGNRWFTCHDVGEHFYWTMGNPWQRVSDVGWDELKGTRLINRKPITAKPVVKDAATGTGRGIRWGFAETGRIRASAQVPKHLPAEFARLAGRALYHADMLTETYRRLSPEDTAMQAPAIQAFYQHEWLAAVIAARRRPMRCVTDGVSVHYVGPDALLSGGADGWTSLLITADDAFGGGVILAGDETLTGAQTQRLVAVTGPFSFGGVTFGMRAVVEARYRELT